MVELPKDATGCGIPPTTTLLYGKSGRNMGCGAMAFNSIKQRIRNLGGETDDC